jgi:hypothetical protein
VHEVTEVDWQDTEIQEKKNPRKKKKQTPKSSSTCEPSLTINITKFVL